MQSLWPFSLDFAISDFQLDLNSDFLVDTPKNSEAYHELLQPEPVRSVQNVSAKKSLCSESFSDAVVTD